MVTTQRLGSTSTTTQFAFAFDYESSGKQDYLLYYSPGTGDATIIKNNRDGTFTKVYPQSSSSSGFGAGNVDLTNLADRVIAFDYLGSGHQDHLLCYRPGNGDASGNTPGAASILQKNADGTFTAVFTSSNGIGGYNLADYSHDRIIAYDYLSNGCLDHLVCYRPGTGIVWILKNNSGNFSSAYASNSSGPATGIGGYDLSSSSDLIIAYDYSSTGHLDHLVCYRPGTGAIFFLKNTNGTFSSVPPSVGDPGNGVSNFNLSELQDRIIAYDYSGSGHPDHLLCYRPGTGLVYILKNDSGTFSPIYPANPTATPNGIGGYDLQSTADLAFTLDYDSSGSQNYLVFYRPGDSAMPVTTN